MRTPPPAATPPMQPALQVLPDPPSRDCSVWTWSTEACVLGSGASEEADIVLEIGAASKSWRFGSANFPFAIILMSKWNLVCEILPLQRFLRGRKHLLGKPMNETDRFEQ